MSSSPAAATPRGLAAASLANSVQHMSRHHSPSEDPQLSSTESFSTLDDDSSDDEQVVYSVSDLSVVSAPRTDGLSDDEDYVLLGRPDSVLSLPSGLTSLSASLIHSQRGAPVDEVLADAFAHLQVESDSDTDSDLVRPMSQATTRRSRRRKPRSSAGAPAQPPSAGAAENSPATPRKKAASAPVSPQTSPSKKALKKLKRQRKKARAKAKAAAQAAQGPKKAAAQGVKPKASNVTVTPSAIVSASFYQEAVSYISTFLSTPSETKKQSNLTLLQALIVELGLCPPTASEAAEQSFSHLSALPRTIRAAKALLKERVFVNVRDYLDVRHKGLAALQSIMHPNRKALVQDLSRGKGKRRVPRDLVKESGLGVLLVTCCR